MKRFYPLISKPNQSTDANPQTEEAAQTEEPSQVEEPVQTESTPQSGPPMSAEASDNLADRVGNANTRLELGIDAIVSDPGYCFRSRS